jgi:hypothetical protein
LVKLAIERWFSQLGDGGSPDHERGLIRVVCNTDQAELAAVGALVALAAKTHARIVEVGVQTHKRIKYWYSGVC